MEIRLKQWLYGIPVVPIVEKEDRMAQTQHTIVAALMEQLIAEGPEGMAQVFTTCPISPCEPPVAMDRRSPAEVRLRHESRMRRNACNLQLLCTAINLKRALALAGWPRSLPGASRMGDKLTGLV